VALLGAFQLVKDDPTVSLMFSGAVITAIALTLAMGFKAVEAIGLRPVPLAICAATVIALSVLRLPLLWVAGVGAPLSIALAWWALKRGRPF
jgi:chromate transporter